MRTMEISFQHLPTIPSKEKKNSVLPPRCYFGKLHAQIKLAHSVTLTFVTLVYFELSLTCRYLN